MYDSIAMLDLCRNSLLLCLGSYVILSRNIDAMQRLFCENLNSTKLRMKHLGGMVYVEWFPRGFTCGITLVDGHPGNKGI